LHRLCRAPRRQDAVGVNREEASAEAVQCPTLDDDEFEELLEKTVEFTDHRWPIYYGLGGNNTAKILKMIKVVEKYHIDGILRYPLITVDQTKRDYSNILRQFPNRQI